MAINTDAPHSLDLRSLNEHVCSGVPEPSLDRETLVSCIFTPTTLMRLAIHLTTYTANLQLSKGRYASKFLLQDHYSPH